ncbi:MAG TPA: hypothetical protein VMV49_08215 [Candidatus Deferrimicrobium sp.]|nr:hypothetical protein [Candidatus Deferrimicrobium sp.]
MNLEYSPGRPEDLFGKKARLLVAQMTYPELLGFLQQHRTSIQVEEDLRDIGKRICTKLLELWNPKAKTIMGLTKELMKVLWNGKIAFKILERDAYKRPTQVLFIDKDCKLCKSEGEIVEAEGVHYCAAVSGFIETLLNAQKGTMKLSYTTVKVKTISSRASGDKECIHSCEFMYE